MFHLFRYWEVLQAVVQLELTVPVSCPRTCSILGMMPGRYLRFSQLFSWCL